MSLPPLLAERYQPDGPLAVWREVKGLLSFSNLALTRVPLDVTTSKLSEDLCGKSVWYCGYRMYVPFRWINWRVSVFLWPFFCHGNLSLYQRIVKLFSQRKLSVSLSDQSPEVSVLVVSAWWARRWKCRGDEKRVVVRCWTDIEVSSAKAVLCGWGGIGINKSVKITKRNQGDVNKSANTRRRLLPRN